MSAEREENPPTDSSESPRPDSSRPNGSAISVPIGLFILLGVCGGAIYFVKRPEFFDHQIGNFLTLVIGFLAFVSVVVWFSLLRSVPIAIRLAVPIVLIVGTGMFFVFYRIEEVSGEMIPKFTYRFAPPADAQLGELQPTAAGVDLSLPTPEDFPQFLGPARDLKYDAVRLADWPDGGPELVWRQPIGAGWSGFTAVNGYAVTMEQRGEEELVTCYKIETGDVAWVHSHPWRHETILGGVGPRSTPTIDGGMIYAMGAGGTLFCLAGESGDVLWQKDLLTEFNVSAEADAKNIAWGRAASPLIVDDKVIVPAGGPTDSPVSLVAYNKLTGEEVWRGGSTQISYSSPALVTLGGTPQVLIVNESTLSAHDLATGEELWSHPWPGSSNTDASSSQAVPLPGDRVLVSKGYGGGAALLQIDNENGEWNAEPLWHHTNVLKTKFSNVAVDQEVAYALSDGILEAVDLAEGDRLWKKGRYGHGQILMVSGKLLVLAESGEVLLLDIEKRPQTLGEIQAISGKTWNNLCLYGRYLLVRNADEAACYKLPLSGVGSE